MLLQICKLCGLTLPESESLQTVMIEKGGSTTHISVCQRCYNVALNENRNKAKLLVE